MELILIYLKTYSFCVLRPLGLMLIFPLLSSKILNGTIIRNGLMITLAIPIFPLVYNSQVLNDTNNLCFLMLIFKEIFIGFLIGFSAAIPFWAIDISGFIIDNMRGASMASVFNPLIGQQTSLFGLLFNQIFSVLFLITGGLNILLQSLYHSFITIPIDQNIKLNKSFIIFLKGEWALMFKMGISFAMPAIIIMLMIDIALGLVNRSAQQLNVFFLAMPIKSIMAVLLIVTSLNFSFANYLEKVKKFDYDMRKIILQLTKKK